MIMPWLVKRELLQMSIASRQFHEMLQDDYTWCQMCRVRFGASELHGCPSFRELYSQMAANTLSVTFFDIVWNDGLYWRMQQSDESTYGEFAKLNAVSWFHVTYTHRSVPRGSYYVFYRYRFTEHESRTSLMYKDLNLKAVAVKADGTDGSDSSYPMCRGFQASTMDEVAEGWRVGVNFYSQLVIDAPWQDVAFRFIDTSSSSKIGLDLDCALLIPVDQVSQVPPEFDSHLVANEKTTDLQAYLTSVAWNRMSPAKFRVNMER